MFENWKCWDASTNLIYALKADYGFKIVVSFSAENDDRWWFDCYALRVQQEVRSEAFPTETLRDLMRQVEEKQKSAW